MVTRSDRDSSVLTLGWQVTSTQDPRYWLNNSAEPGEQATSDLVQIPANTIASHSVIVAQSGSGKSYFLGRLVEEIMLRTRGRCVILDPNADFRRINEVEDAELWENASYNPLERRGKLPHEKSRDEFSQLWKEVPIRVRTGSGAHGRAHITSSVNEQLKLWWPSLSMAFLAEDLNPILRTDLYHCHAFTKSLAEFAKLNYLATGKNLNIIDEAHKIFRLARGLEKADLREALQQEFDIVPIVNKMKPFDFEDADASSEQWFTIGDPENLYVYSMSWVQNAKEGLIELGLTLDEYVSSEIERFYFGKAREYIAASIIEVNVNAEPTRRSLRLEVVDLPSLPDSNTALLAINAILTTEWERVRNIWSGALDRPANSDRRVPTFIVVDEAHNLIPTDARGKPAVVLREQFRTIAAEGRKYGLYLIMVSQRPDKLDPLVVSECENKAVMRIGSASVLDITRKMLGLDDLPPKQLEKCLEFETGRVLLVGRWAPGGSQIIYSAARRTIEGGRNLREEFWARPFPRISHLEATMGSNGNNRSGGRTKSSRAQKPATSTKASKKK